MKNYIREITLQLEIGELKLYTVHEKDVPQSDRVGIYFKNKHENFDATGFLLKAVTNCLQEKYEVAINASDRHTLQVSVYALTDSWK